MRRRTIAIAAAAGAGALMLARRRALDDVTGEVAIVTGASRGLGFLIARELGREGCKVAICARDAEELERARVDLESEGIDVLAVPADVSAPDQVARLVDDVRERWGRVDVLVNNAGIIQVGPVESLTAKDFERAMNVMYWGVLHTTLAVLPEMRERGHGRIVNVTSIGGKIAAPDMLPYSSAKFAAVGFSEGLAAELTGTGVNVTTVTPGFMRTGSWVNALFKGADARNASWFAAGSSIPGIAMDAERAARRIVESMRRGDTERSLTWWAPLAIRVKGLFPTVGVRVAGLMKRFILPESRAGDTDTGVRGGVALASRDSAVTRALTKPGLNAAARYNEYPGPERGAQGRGRGETPVR